MYLWYWNTLTHNPIFFQCWFFHQLKKKTKIMTFFTRKMRLACFTGHCLLHSLLYKIVHGNYFWQSSNTLMFNLLNLLFLIFHVRMNTNFFNNTTMANNSTVNTYNFTCYLYMIHCITSCVNGWTLQLLKCRFRLIVYSKQFSFLKLNLYVIVLMFNT